MLDVYEFLAKEKKTLPHGIADLSRAPIAQPLTPTKTPATLQEEAVRALKDAVASADVARGFRQAEAAAPMPEVPAMPISPLADIAKGFRSVEAMAPLPAPAVVPIQSAADIARGFRQAGEPERQFQQWYADGTDTITGKPGATPKQLAQLKEMLENEDHPTRKQMLEQAPSAWKQAFNTFKRSSRILAENAFLSLNLGVRPEVFYGEEGLLGKAPVEPVTIPEKITAGVGSILGSLPWFIMPETSVAKGIPLQPQGMLKLSGEAMARIGPQTAKGAIVGAARRGAGAVGTISAIEAIAQKMSPKDAVKHIGLSTAAGALFAGGISAARIGISRIPQSDLGKMFHREYLRTRGYNQLGEELGFTADRGTGVWSKYDKKGNLSNIVIETRTPENERALKVFDQLLRTYPDYAQGLGSAEKATKATAEVRALLPRQPVKEPGKIIPEDMFYPKEKPAVVRQPGLLPGGSTKQAVVVKHPSGDGFAISFGPKEWVKDDKGVSKWETIVDAMIKSHVPNVIVDKNLKKAYLPQFAIVDDYSRDELMKVLPEAFFRENRGELPGGRNYRGASDYEIYKELLSRGTDEEARAYLLENTGLSPEEALKKLEAIDRGTDSLEASAPPERPIMPLRPITEGPRAGHPSAPEPAVAPTGQVVPTSTAKPDDTPPQAEKTSEEGVTPIPEPSKPGEIAAGMKPRSILSADEVASAIAALRGESVEPGATEGGKVVKGEEPGAGEVAGTSEEPEKPLKPAGVATGKIAKMRQAAEAMQKQIDEKRNPAVANQAPTARRARIAENMRADADRLEDIQSKLIGIADAMEKGDMPKSLEGVETKVAIETLLHYKAFPAPTITQFNAKDLLEWTKGAKGSGEPRSLLAKIRFNEHSRISNLNDKEMEAVEKLIKIAEKKGHSTKDIKDRLAPYKRLARLGITNEVSFKQAKADLNGIGKKRVGPSPGESKIKETERSLIGRKIPGYFPTPQPVVNEMLKKAEIKPGMTVLEPSAGKGNIAKNIKDLDVSLDVIEINPTLRELLELKDYNVVGQDFLKHSGKYDRIIMNPPFENGQDVEHVRHAHDLLKPGGRIVTIMSESPFFRSGKKYEEFREWIDDIGGESEKLPEKSFTGKEADRQTGVSARIVVIDKPEIQGAGEAGEKAAEGAGKEEGTGKEVASLDDLKEEIGEKINEAVGDVNIPIGQSIKIVSGSPRSRGTFSSSDPDVDKRVKDSHGVKSPGTFSKIKELMDTIARKASREYEHLPKGAEFAQLRFDLLKLSKQKDVASYSTLKLIQGILLEFDKDPAGYNHFEWKVLLSDLSEEAKQDNALPFGYTTDILDADIEALDKAIAAKFPQVERAMKIRRKIWDTIVNEYTKAQEAIGHKVGDKLERREYFRHQVMDYANEKAMRGTGKRLRTPTGRGFLKERKGSTLDINTNYLEAEYEVMAQMLYDIEVAKVIKDIDERDNIVRTLKAQAVAVNDERIMPMFEQMAEQLSQSKEPGKEVTAESLYRQILNSKQAIGFEKLGKMAMRGELPVDSKRKYEGLINKLSETYIANTLVGSPDDKASLPEWAMKQVFPYLNWLLKQQHVTDKAKGAAATIFKGIAEKKKAIKAALGDRYITWEDIIPDGYVKWQPREGNVFYFADTIPAQKAQLLFAQGLAQIGLTADEVEQVLVMGQRLPEMVLKEEIALTLDNLVKDRQSDMLSQTLRKIIQGWKVYQLISPKRWAKYNIRNVSGDADPTFIGNPSTFKKVPQSAKELLAVYFGDGAMTEAMRRWFERGGMQSTMQVQEMGDINQLKMFVDLVERRGKITEVPAKAWQGYWKAARLSTDYREAILRYAAFLDYKEQMKGNKEGRPKNFGASIPEEIMALKDIDDRAFWLSNDLLGAYDKVSVLGQWTRENLIPFWSWKEVNFKRYIQFAKNAVRDESLCRMVGNTALAKLKRAPATALRVGKFIIKALALWAMLETFNHAFFPEEEFELSPDVRNTPHIVLGRDKKGRAKYFPRLGALGDFVEWFGLEEAPGLARDFLNGKKNLKEIANEMAKGPVNAFVQGIGPQYTIPVELIFGRKIFPDVFKPGMIRDKGYYIAQSLGLENEYAVIMKLPRRPYADSLEKMAVYKQDPGQGSYYEILDLKREFQEKIGKPTGFMSAVSPKSQALYNLKLAIRYQDKVAFDKYAAEYISYGGTDKDLKTSLNNMHPLHGLNKKEKKLFLEWLDDDDKKRLGLAIIFYEETLLGKGRQEKEE